MGDHDDFVAQWSDQAESGSLLTPKHDSNNLSTTWGGYRSVLSHSMSASLETFIKSGDYDVNRYHDAVYSGPGFFEVIPRPSSGFAVVGSGVPAGSTYPTGSCDRLVVVSGSVQGWHVYAADSRAIAADIATGRLTLSGSF